MHLEDCYFAEDVLYFPEGHCWISFRGDKAVLGPDTIIAWITGKAARVSVRQPGTSIEPGRMVASLEGPRHFDVIRSPVRCTVTVANPDLELNPSLVNKDPYGRGWLAEVKVAAGNDVSSSLKSFHEAAPLFEKMITEMGVRCFKEFPDHELYEIGTECSAVLVKLNDLLSGSDSGTVVHVVSDDPTAEVELIRWSDQTGNRLLEARTEANLRHFILKKS
ncbi:MAG: hypothetical protein JRN68_05455 [Nitrososphaerota archaeon]|nr:hypothetical protein [Nitrososphaerota archaeon]